MGENGTVAERNHTAAYGDGAAARGEILRSVGIHQVRFRIDRMYLNRKLFIGVYSPNYLLKPHPDCIGDMYQNEIFYIRSIFGGMGKKTCGIPASGWFGNDSIAIHGTTYDSNQQAGSEYTDNYEQYYITNDVVTLTMNCEEGKLTLKNERTNKEYHMFIDPVHSNLGKLPWRLYINLYYPGDKIRFLPVGDD